MTERCSLCYCRSTDTSIIFFIY